MAAIKSGIILWFGVSLYDDVFHIFVIYFIKG